MAADEDAGNPYVGAVEKLLGGVALLGALLYVLVNALYIEFYDDFGIRPEQVGFDRLAVLARSAWLALIGVLILAPVSAGIAWRARHKALAQTRGRAGGEPEAGARIPWTTGQIMGLGLYAGALVIVAGFAVMIRQVDEEAARVADGHNSNGVGLVVPVVDARANRAEVTWLDPDQNSPQGLVEAPFLTYLGSGSGVTVLLACGETTYVVQSSDVAVRLLGQGRAEELSDEQESREFQDACG